MQLVQCCFSLHFPSPSLCLFFSFLILDGEKVFLALACTEDHLLKKHLRYYLVLIYFSQNFSGQKNLQPSRRPPPYPSQHTSHFSIGIVPGHDLDTHSRKTFVRHHTGPVSEVPVISIILNNIRLMYGPEGNS